MAGLGNITSGRCDVCHLDCLKLAPLTCLRHFCCSTCRKHCSKLQKNQHFCDICERREFECQNERRRESRAIDSFIDAASSQRKNSIFKDVQLTMTGSRLISLNDDPEDNDQSDLTGNNDEWELLISSLSYKPSCAEPIDQQKTRSPPKAKSPEHCTKAGTQKTEPKTKDNSLSPKESKPTPPDKYSDDSRIYNWCLAAEKSLSSSSKSSARFEPFKASNQAACLSSSSENHMGRKKFQRQTKKKDRPIWCDDSESDEEDWSECFSRRNNIDKSEKKEETSDVALGANRQTACSKPNYINIPNGKSEESCFPNDWYTVNAETNHGPKEVTKIQEAPGSARQSRELMGLMGKNSDYSDKAITKTHPHKYEGLGQSSENVKNVNIDIVFNREPKKYCINDVNCVSSGQTLRQRCNKEGATAKHISQSKGIGDTFPFNVQYQIANNGISFKNHERKEGASNNIHDSFKIEKPEDKDPYFGNKFAQSSNKGVHGTHGIDLKLSQPMRVRKAGDDSDGSSYDCGSIEGPLSDQEYPAFEDEDSRWQRVNTLGTPVDLHDTFWDQ